MNKICQKCSSPGLAQALPSMHGTARWRRIGRDAYSCFGVVYLRLAECRDNKVRVTGARDSSPIRSTGMRPRFDGARLAAKSSFRQPFCSDSAEISALFGANLVCQFSLR